MSLDNDGGMIYWRGKTEELGEKPVSVPLCPPQFPHGLTWTWTRASTVSGRWLNNLSHGTAWSGMLLLADHSCCSYPPFCSFVCKTYTPILSCPIACTDNGFIFRRLDYFILSQKLIPNLCDNIIRSQVYGSDHCPITLLINIWSVPF
jgi:hypothetical protein